jgi:hypothetical protein
MTATLAAIRFDIELRRWRYRGAKLERAQRRFAPDCPAAPRRDRLLDLIGGRPSAG